MWFRHFRITERTITPLSKIGLPVALYSCKSQYGEMWLLSAGSGSQARVQLQQQVHFSSLYKMIYKF